MNWIESERRWRRRENGVTYRLRPKQLRCPPTMEGSLLAANEWWKGKEAELSKRNRKPEPGSPEAHFRLLEAYNGGPVSQSQEAEVVQEIIANGALTPEVVKAFLGPAELTRAVILSPSSRTTARRRWNGPMPTRKTATPFAVESVRHGVSLA
jgi:hypothetical protein